MKAEIGSSFSPHISIRKTLIIWGMCRVKKNKRMILAACIDGLV